MISYDYHKPGSLDEALALHASVPGARFIAGGTDLMINIKNGDEQIIPVTSKKQPIQPGDTILLERSNVALRFIMRSSKKAA